MQTLENGLTRMDTRSEKSKQKRVEQNDPHAEASKAALDAEEEGRIAATGKKAAASEATRLKAEAEAKVVTEVEAEAARLKEDKEAKVAAEAAATAEADT